jgi:hypothetical protein
MQIHEVCLASDWEFDRDLFLQLEEQLRLRGHSTFLVWPHNLDDTLRRLEDRSLGFRYLVDRASNTSPEFLAVYRLLVQQGVRCFENPETMLWASDKATMHLEFLSAGIPVPHTLILEPFAERENLELPAGKLLPLGEPFVIKPANTTGGGIGVFQDGRCIDDIIRLRKEHRADKYLIQERILPKVHDGNHCWFRMFYACGDVHCCRWHESTHVYESLSDREAVEQGLQRLYDITRRIAEVCSLQLFSAEIAIDPQDRFVVVDYVNESPDLRRKSRSADGVPDEIVDRIVGRLAVSIHEQLAGEAAGSI